MNTLTEIFTHRIVAILRGAGPDDVLKIASALYRGGIRILEVTLNSEDALQSIEKLSGAMPADMHVGAGTVLNAMAVRAAVSAGARFIISPSLDADVIGTTKELGAVSVPGAYTPTEIVTAFRYGGDIIKVFPSSSNVNYIKEIRAPLPDIPLMPTGGITKENLRAYFKAGASAVGIGTALVKPGTDLTEEYVGRLTENAREFVQIKNEAFS